MYVQRIQLKGRDVLCHEMSGYTPDDLSVFRRQDVLLTYLQNCLELQTTLTEWVNNPTDRMGQQSYRPNIYNGWTECLPGTYYNLTTSKSLYIVSINHYFIHVYNAV